MFAQEPDLSQLHILKDCSNHALGHELVPIVTMNEQQVLADGIDNNLPPPPMQIQMGSIQQSQQTSPMTLQSTIQTSQTTTQTIGSTVLTGVYTLTEEPELEAEENTSM